MRTKSLGVLLVLTACSSSADPSSTDEGTLGGTEEVADGAAGSHATTGGSTGSGGHAGQQGRGGAAAGGGGKGTGGSAANGGHAGQQGTGGGAETGGAPGNPDAGPVTPLPCPTATGTAGVWQNVTPGGASVPNVAASDVTPGVIYAGTSQKGIHKSSDCGATWTKVNTGRNGAALDSGTPWLFLIDPITADVLYADAFGGSNNNLFKSTNGGVDWDPLWAPDGVVAKAAGYPELLGIDPQNHLHLVANFHQNCNAPYTPVCFGESTDGGATWRIVNGPSELGGWAEDAAPIVVDATTFLLGSGWSPLYLTKDAGATWTKVAGSGGLRMVHENGWYYVGAAFSVQRSRDLIAWTEPPNTPGLVGFGLVSDGATLFASSRYGINYEQAPVSDGATWSKLAAPTGLAGSDGSYSLAIDKSHRILYSANQGSGLYRMLLP